MCEKSKNEAEQDVKVILQQPAVMCAGKTDAAATGIPSKGRRHLYHNEAEWRNRGNYLEIVDCVVSRMRMEHLKRRINEVFCEADRSLFSAVLHTKRNTF